jgi:hypothetical protein
LSPKRTQARAKVFRDELARNELPTVFANGTRWRPKPRVGMHAPKEDTSAKSAGSSQLLRSAAFVYPHQLCKPLRGIRSLSSYVVARLLSGRCDPRIFDRCDSLEIVQILGGGR